MGLGIEARFRRCRSFWQKHLELSKKFQLETLERFYQKSGGRLAILGAGRLLDVPLQSLESRFKEIALIDVDPSLRLPWWFLRQKHPALRCFFADVSGCIPEWTRSLEHFLASTKQDSSALASFLRALEVPKVTAETLTSGARSSFDVGISINLLSQISIYWQDRVQDVLKRKWGLRADAKGHFDSPIEEALAASKRKLQLQHVDTLGRFGAELLIVINDSFFHYYTKDRSEWQTEAALNIAEEEVKVSGFSLGARDSWLWHIIPQGIEEPDYGCIHEVVGRAFTKIKDFRTP